jgi:hypothetical protein
MYIYQSLYMAGKAYENAAQMALKVNRVEQAEELYLGASKYFQANGTGDRAADMFEKAAKLVSFIAQLRQDL